MKNFEDFPPYYNLLKMKEDVIFDHTFDIIFNSEHILKNEVRFPEFKSFNGDTLNSFFDGVAAKIPKLIARNPRIAISQYYDNELGFFVPVRLPESGKIAALAVARQGKKYSIKTCLTLEMAYHHARVVGRVESSWLKLD